MCCPTLKPKLHPWCSSLKEAPAVHTDRSSCFSQPLFSFSTETSLMTCSFAWYSKSWLLQPVKPSPEEIKHVLLYTQIFHMHNDRSSSFNIDLHLLEYHHPEVYLRDFLDGKASSAVIGLACFLLPPECCCHGFGWGWAEELAIAPSVSGVSCVEKNASNSTHFLTGGLHPSCCHSSVSTLAHISVIPLREVQTHGLTATRIVVWGSMCFIVLKGE